MGGRDAIARCGIPKAALRGFRCPYLSDKPEVRQVLFENGFRYDSTIGAHGGNNRQFPATMDKVCWVEGIMTEQSMAGGRMMQAVAAQAELPRLQRL